MVYYGLCIMENPKKDKHEFMFITQKHKLSVIFVNVAISYNGSRLGEVGDLEALNFKLSTND